MAPNIIINFVDEFTLEATVDCVVLAMNVSSGLPFDTHIRLQVLNNG